MVASLAVAAMAGCGGSNTAGARQETAVTRSDSRSASSNRTPTRQTTTRPQTQQPTQHAATAPATTAQANPAPAATTAPAPATASAAAPKGEWRPAWWITSPVQQGGTVKVAAMADDADLLEARRKAVNLGLSDLRSLVGGGDAADNALLDADTTIDVISLPDGRYRAFVLVEAR